LIDTPGFDDTNRRDIDVLKDVSFWLNKAYNENIILTGIIYLQSISASRIGGTALKDLTMFKKLCGEDSYASVVIGTTFWEDTDVHSGSLREGQLKKEQMFYAPLLQGGATMMRHFNQKHSALSIVSHLVDRGTTTILHIQKELKNGKTLDETEAGAELERAIIEERKKSLKALEQSRLEMQEALEKRDEVMAARLAEQQDELEAILQAKEQEREELRVDMEKLFQEKEQEFRALKQQLSDQQEEQRARAGQIQELQAQVTGATQELAARKNEVEEQNRRLEKTDQENLRQAQKFARMEENLRLANEDAEKKALELSNAQTDMAKMLLEISRKPENYQSDPPSYSSVTEDSDASSDLDDVIAASLLVGAGASAGFATTTLAPVLLPLAAVACTMM